MMTFNKIDKKIKEYESLVRCGDNEFSGEFLAEMKGTNTLYRNKLEEFEILDAECDGDDDSILIEANQWFKVEFERADKWFKEEREDYAYWEAIAEGKLDVFFVFAYYFDDNGEMHTQTQCESVFGPAEMGRIYLSKDTAERAAKEYADALREADVDGRYAKIEFEVDSLSDEMPKWATEIIDANGQSIAAYSVAPTDHKGSVSGEYAPAKSWDDANRQNGMIRRTIYAGGNEYKYSYSWQSDSFWGTEAKAAVVGQRRQKLSLDL